MGLGFRIWGFRVLGALGILGVYSVKLAVGFRIQGVEFKV